MGFAEAVRTCVSKYATFSGRTRRSDYRWSVVDIVVLLRALGLVHVLHTTVRGGGVGWVYFTAVLAPVIPNVAVTVRRLHDTAGPAGGGSSPFRAASVPSSCSACSTRLLGRTSPARRPRA